MNDLNAFGLVSSDQQIPISNESVDNGTKKDGFLNKLSIKNVGLLALAGITAFYLYQSMFKGGVQYSHEGVQTTRSIFAWVDVILGLGVALIILKVSRTILR